MNMTEQMESPELPTSEPAGPTFDLSKDPIPSFGALQQERAKVFTKQSDLDSFKNSVAALSDSGEEGRRKGLGYWLVGDFKKAVAILEGFASDDVASFTLANALMSMGRPGDARPIFERLSNAYPDEPRPRGGMLDAACEADVLKGDAEATLANLQKALADSPESFRASAEGRYLQGRVEEFTRSWQEALDEYRAAREVDPTHRANLFRLAYVAERCGLDELALECYESLASMLPIDKNVLMNMGLLFEDFGREQDAAACYDLVVANDPTDRLARLFLEDAKAGMVMYYDEDMEKKEDRLNQILRIPITDFELSVRARNCLNKMNILSLGDLVKKTEAELLSYKNFGETSLNEIKEILGSKNLRLGMDREEAVLSISKGTNPYAAAESGDILARPLADLKLSIRARRTVENLGCLTIGDINNHSEEELLGMPNFGVTSLLELKQKLGEINLKLKGE
jgi:DNA-directed RNA polymerase subunit alpha